MWENGLTEQCGDVELSSVLGLTVSALDTEINKLGDNISHSRMWTILS